MKHFSNGNTDYKGVEGKVVKYKFNLFMSLLYGTNPMNGLRSNFNGFEFLQEVLLLSHLKHQFR